MGVWLLFLREILIEVYWNYYNYAQFFSGGRHESRFLGGVFKRESCEWINETFRKRDEIVIFADFALHGSHTKKLKKEILINITEKSNIREDSLAYKQSTIKPIKWYEIKMNKKNIQQSSALKEMPEIFKEKRHQRSKKQNGIIMFA